MTKKERTELAAELTPILLKLQGLQSTGYTVLQMANPDRDTLNTLQSKRDEVIAELDQIIGRLRG